MEREEVGMVERERVGGRQPQCQIWSYVETALDAKAEVSIRD
jgi:hypothetical protein